MGVSSVIDDKIATSQPPFLPRSSPPTSPPILFFPVPLLLLLLPLLLLRLSLGLRFPEETDADLVTISQFCFPETTGYQPIWDADCDTYLFILTSEDATRQYGYCRRFLPPSKGMVGGGGAVDMLMRFWFR